MASGKENFAVVTEEPQKGGPPPAYNEGPPMQMMAPVTGQPQAGYGGGGGMMGLEYLATLDTVKIHQVLHLEEVLLGWERNNRYQLCNVNEQQFMTAKEETDCCTRQWCGNIRPFDIYISDTQGQQIIHMNRDFHCQGCMCPCSLQSMDIFFPIGQKVATIKEMWTCMTPRYEIYDATGELLFKIEGPKCWCACCTDIVYEITRSDGKEAGNITKHWGGFRELVGQVNDFSVNFAQGETPANKAILLGSTFLVDFMYFERKNNK